MISITRNAWKKLGHIKSETIDFRGFLFGARGGGCNGFNFDLSILNEDKYHKLLTQKPNILTDKDINVFIDPLSEIYLIGTTIDYQYEDFSKGIYENKFLYHVDKKTTATCACGTSFTTRNL